MTTRIRQKVTCNLCKEQLTGGPDGFRKHGEEHHPGHYFREGSYNFAEKKYYNPIIKTWFAARKYLARSITDLGMTNEEYFLQYGEKYMPDEWHELHNDEKYGSARAEPFCKQCHKSVKFQQMKWSYPAFCGFSCSAKWHAENTDRIDRAMETLRERKEKDPTYHLRPNQKEYWINKGHTEDDAIKLVKERQTTNTLEKFVERYGEDEGQERFTQRQEKWLDSLQKSGMYSGYSKMSFTLFEEVEKSVNKKLLYGKEERSIRGSSIYKVDCLCEQSKKIIEFNGDYWHANPKYYKPTDIIKGKRQFIASEKWEYDKKKLDELKDKGYDVMVVWEDDYRTNPDKILGMCIGFMM